MRLSEMGIGSCGVIVQIENKELEVVLMGLGLVRGDRFEVSELAPWGGPMALRVNGGKIALGRRDAGQVIVSKN